MIKPIYGSLLIATFGCLLSCRTNLVIRQMLPATPVKAEPINSANKARKPAKSEILAASYKAKRNECGFGFSIPGVAGIPFRVKKPFTIFVYKNVGNEDEPEYKQVHKIRERLPDPRQIYTVNYCSGFWSDENLTLNFNPDSTLSKANLTTDFKGSEGLTALAGQIAALNGKLRENERATASTLDRARADLDRIKAAQEFENQFKKKQKSEEEIEEEEENRLKAIAAQEAAVADAYTKMLEVDLRQAQYDQIKDTEASEVDKIEALNGWRLAQFNANAAYRAAGLAEPFPGLSP